MLKIKQRAFVEVNQRQMFCSKLIQKQIDSAGMQCGTVVQHNIITEGSYQGLAD